MLVVGQIGSVGLVYSLDLGRYTVLGEIFNFLCGVQNVWAFVWKMVLTPVFGVRVWFFAGVFSLGCFLGV